MNMVLVDLLQDKLDPWVCISLDGAAFVPPEEKAGSAREERRCDGPEGARAESRGTHEP